MSGFAALNGELPALEQDDTLSSNAREAANKRRRTLSYDAAECLHNVLRVGSQQVPAPAAAQPIQPANATTQVTIAAPAPFDVMGQPAATPAAPGPAALIEDTPSSSSTTNSNANMMAMPLNPQEFQWLALLHNRPDIEDTDAMSKWMERVMQVSDTSAAVRASAALVDSCASAALVASPSTNTSTADHGCNSSNTTEDRASNSSDSEDGEEPEQEEKPLTVLPANNNVSTTVVKREDDQRRRSSAWSLFDDQGKPLENLGLEPVDKTFFD